MLDTLRLAGYLELSIVQERRWDPFKSWVASLEDVRLPWYGHTSLWVKVIYPPPGSLGSSKGSGAMEKPLRWRKIGRPGNFEQ